MRFVFNLLILSVFRHYFTDSNCNILNDISHFYVNHTAVSFNSSDEEMLTHFNRQEAQLSPRGPRDASCQLKSCQLPRNSAETTYSTSPDQIDGMKLEV